MTNYHEFTIVYKTPEGIQKEQHIFAENEKDALNFGEAFDDFDKLIAVKKHL